MADLTLIANAVSFILSLTYEEDLLREAFGKAYGNGNNPKEGVAP